MKNHRATIAGFVILVVLMTAGAAQSLSGSNTVFSDDIVDGAVYSTDIHDRAVTGAKVANDSLTGSDVNESSLHPHLAFALVKSSGALAGGNATSSSVGQTNQLYEVVFSFSVAGCSATAVPGAFPGYDSFTPSARANNFYVGNLTANVVQVDFVQSTTRVNTAFMLSLICP